jgi:hypothetical protein
MIKKVRKFSHAALNRKEKIPSPLAICISVCIYFLGALFICEIDRVWLLSAWLFAGPLLFTVYLTLDARGSLLNPYTLFFAGSVVLTLGGYAATHLTV